MGTKIVDEIILNTNITLLRDVITSVEVLITFQVSIAISKQNTPAYSIEERERSTHDAASAYGKQQLKQWSPMECFDTCFGATTTKYNSGKQKHTKHKWTTTIPVSTKKRSNVSNNNNENKRIE